MSLRVLYFFDPKAQADEKQSNRGDISGSYDLSGGCPVGGEGVCAC